MRSMEYIKNLDGLVKKPSFTAAEAKAVGVHPALLNYYVNKGFLERVGHGVYRDPSKEITDEIQYEDLIITATSVKNGVVCLISALEYYGITDEIPREHWIAIPHSSAAPKRKHTRFVRMRNMELGKTKVKVGGVSISMFDRERTVIDSFRYLNIEIAIKALQGYLRATKEHRPDLQKLAKYAKALRTSIRPYVLALTT